MTVMAFACGTMAGNASSGGWENCHLGGEHMHAATLPLKELYKNCKFLPSGCFDTG
jgi:hypothetical protein